jgi:copper(I)-binding protein
MKMMCRIRTPAAALALALLAAGCSRPPQGIAASDVWVRLPAVKGEAGAAYFRLEGGPEGAKLVGVSSPMVRRIELHETRMNGGMAGMKPLKEVEFSYDRKIDFEAGGKHAMLFGIASSVKPGGRIPLTFAFNVAPPLTVEAEVRSAGGESHEGH